MRIDRVRLKNFGGVVEAEVRFAPLGVTIVHGPNETGKSTLMQGINVLFDHRDDSRKEDVRNTKPVNRDVGSEVEADIEIGPYNFTYFKRFHKERETQLTIRTPKPESLSGREAHDRVLQILSGSVDTALWRALRIAQGPHLDMPELHNQPALAQALDRAAGQAKSGEKEEALFEAAHDEFLQYFTETGREKEDPMAQARARAAAAGVRVQDLETQLKEVEDDIGRFAALEKSVATHRRSLTVLEDAQKKAQTDWDDVSKLAANVDRAASAHQLALQATQTAKAAGQQRTDLISRVGKASEAALNAAKLLVTSSDALAEATEKLNSARATWETAQTTAGQRDAEEAIRHADLKFREGEFALVLLEERQAHVREADAEAATASAIVAATRITEKLRAGVRDAELALKTAQGVLNVASPQLTITALQSVSVAINSEAHAFAAGEARVIPVSDAISATVANVAEFRVEPGTSAAALRQEVKEAENVLAKACAKAGVATPEAAEATWTALQDAKRTVADRDRIAKQHLRDLTRETLGQLVEITRATVDAYLGNRRSDLPLPATIDEAMALLDSATHASAQAKRALREAEASLTPVQTHHAKCGQDHAVQAALLDQANKDNHQEAERLEAERRTCSDDVLKTKLASAEAAVGTTLDALQAARGSLGNRDPVSVKEILDSAGPALKAAREQSEGQEQKLLALRTKLELIGDKGLAEALAEAERVAFEARDTLDRLQRRASAAKLLYETLCTEQQAMRKAYVAPLREGIERLGRHVFGPTLRVEVDDRLQVASRTVDGVTVSLEQLSTGAREQMGLLVRLAAASMVSKDGGVPLVLDDALGSTDESRIEAMGAVLRIASQNLQTIILTCSPERYVHVGARVSVPL
jgi:hypothetical protein